ncbi:hypothetical protein BIFGAL_03723 [Bifidobacterium gallicum DSM 20093 = LMG 11596]|uniref:Uncharacterized protein n=1 Tax=Bifidobacterium gallicum DSM 20093 = LMG 11596 TaxID=561180 RepID=D1NV42_9BIFI|nr:hypothetical protein BIFGAL_03723 [Bifidobacterium gallicum DSM 20093 = LMG 11596]
MSQHIFSQPYCAGNGTVSFISSPFLLHPLTSPYIPAAPSPPSRT